MGFVFDTFTLANPRDPSVAPLAVRAMVDTGAHMLCLPQHLVESLRLEVHEHRTIVLASGARQSVPYVGPIQVRYGQRTCFVGAFVLGDSPLVGVIPLEDMDLVVHPLSGIVSGPGYRG